MKHGFFIFFLFPLNFVFAQTVSKVWIADQGNGTYKNPILHADYSDPDAIRVGDDYYMISSSFNHVPGLPILRSKDLVNWTIIGHVLKQLPPDEHFSKVQHGNGVWAPSIRYHDGEFYIYYPDPDFGIYLVKAKKITGPWTAPQLVEEGKGLIDPCPLWDDNGKVYLVHAYAGSRAGIKSILVVEELNKKGTKPISDTVRVFDGHVSDPTVEGPKFYKRNGYYYIFAPAGGVPTGWQLVLRSKNVYGPYERKVVMDQGTTAVNGPHQGAWVTTPTGEDWFIHFQDKKAYGRVVHLQPMKWINDWPLIGYDKNGDGKGEPVLVYKKPNVGKSYPVTTPAESDEFNSNQLGLQWQWQANPGSDWAMLNPSNGTLRLNCFLLPDSTRNLWTVPALLLQKFPAEEFMVTAKLSFHPKSEGEKAGLILLGADYSYISILEKENNRDISFGICRNADQGETEKMTDGGKISSPEIFLRARVRKGAICSFSYSENGKLFKLIGEEFMARPGRWVGAKIGIFCTGLLKTNDRGFAEFDWFRVEAIAK